MNLIEIDVVHPQAPQAVVDGMHNMLARQPAVIGIVAHWHVYLRGDDHAVAPRPKVFQGAAEDFFAFSDRIHVGGIEVINSEFQRLADEWPRLFLFEHPRPPLLRSVSHGAEAKTRNFQSSRSKIDVFHSRESLASVWVPRTGTEVSSFTPAGGVQVNYPGVRARLLCAYARNNEID